MPPRSLGPRIALLTLSTLAVFAGFRGNTLPPVRPATAPDSAVSAARAMPDLTVISATPHAVGTMAHDRLRDDLVDRLRALDCGDVHIQSAVGFNTLDGPIAATIANVVCRKQGLHGGPAILLTAHYDAVPRSFGAADDGSGVAALLETLRALDASPPLDRDVIILFSDAEEDGLLGAEAFVDLHPWAHDVGVVLNFDARGDQGPVFMFQTSAGNAPLIAALAHGVPDARTNSLTGEVYRHLPSDTDLSIWLHSAFGVGTLNFANVGGYTHYHTPIDNLASLDLRTVQQMADYALGLTKYFGHTSLARVVTHDDIYTSLPVVGVVHYATTWAMVLAIVALLLVLIWMAQRVRRHAITLGGTARGTLLVLTMVMVPAVATALLWLGSARLHPGYADILQGDPYNSRWYLLAAVAITVAIVAGLVAWHDHKADPDEMIAPALLLWGLLGVIVAAAVPGASYLFSWPLLITAIVLLLPAAMRLNWFGAIVLGIAAVPALILWPPLIESLETGLTVKALPLCALLLSLMLILLLPQFLSVRSWMRALAGFSALVTIGAIIGAEATAGWSAVRKHPDSLDYAIDATTHEARWLSFDRQPDVWTASALGIAPTRRMFPGFAFTDDQAMLASAPQADTTQRSGAPQVDTTMRDASREIHLHLPRSGSGEIVSISCPVGLVVTSMMINGRTLSSGTSDRYHPGYPLTSDGRLLSYYGVPPEGVDLRFTVRQRTPVTLRIETGIEGFPVTLPPRPANLMSKPFIGTDMTMVERTITI